MKLTYIDHCGSDLSVVNAARVSFKKKHEEFQENDKQLIKYLFDHGHHSPFNHAFLSCHVKAPIFVARQLVKHKFMPWNEVSRRYVDDAPELYWPERLEWRVRSEDKKQGSSDETLILPFDMVNPWEDAEPRHYEDYCLSSYDYLLEQGVAPEQARMVLPLNTYTEWYWSGTLGAWMDMVKLRTKEDTQWETRQVALQAKELLKEYFPVSMEAMDD